MLLLIWILCLSVFCFYLSLMHLVVFLSILTSRNCQRNRGHWTFNALSAVGSKVPPKLMSVTYKEGLTCVGIFPCIGIAWMTHHCDKKQPQQQEIGKDITVIYCHCMSSLWLISLFTVWHVMQHTVLLSQFCLSVCLSIYQTCVFWQN